MGKRLESSAERRLQALRRELTLDLFTQRGPFWAEVRWLRSLRGVAAEALLPPALDPGTVHLPPDLPPSRWAWEPAQRQGFREWMVLLQVLHDAAVPPEHRVETPYSSSLEF